MLNTYIFMCCLKIFPVHVAADITAAGLVLTYDC